MSISLKQSFPFRLATTSFIHAAGYTENVRRLAPLVDEIELLCLERDHLPSTDEINALQSLADPLDISYNVHLPMDIALADPSPQIRSRSRDAVLEALATVAPLNAATHTLHITFQESDTNPDTVKAWQTRAQESLFRLLDRAQIGAERLSVETLDFPPRWLLPFVAEFDLPVCLDVGHVIRYGYDLKETLELFSRRIVIYHLHGVTGIHDHRALSHLSHEYRSILVPHLKHFRGTVSLEVFSKQDLMDSLASFAQMMSQVWVPSNKPGS